MKALLILLVFLPMLFDIIGHAKARCVFCNTRPVKWHPIAEAPVCKKHQRCV